MHKRLLDHYGNVVETLDFDEKEGTATIHQYADLQDTMDVIQEDAKNQVKTASHMRKAATIPLVVMDRWEDDLKIPRGSLMKKEYWNKLKQLLNDSDNKMFRVWQGNI